MVDFVIITVGLEAIGDHLQTNRVAHWNDVEADLAVCVGLELHRSLVFVTLDGMKNDVSILDRFAVVGFQHGDLNARSRRRSLVFAPAAGVIVLGADERARNEMREAKWTQNRRNEARDMLLILAPLDATV